MQADLWAEHAKTLEAKAKDILEFLNTKAGKNFRPVKANLKFIIARLHESTVQECKAIIAKKVRDWKDNQVMAPYLRPATLFNATKFAQYQGELNHKGGSNDTMP